jgi:hypothetical protein
MRPKVLGLTAQVKILQGLIGWREEWREALDQGADGCKQLVRAAAR